MGRDVAARILIVDDHEDNIDLLRARLEARGYAIDAAMDGEQALARVELAELVLRHGADRIPRPGAGAAGHRTVPPR